MSKLTGSFEARDEHELAELSDVVTAVRTAMREQQIGARAMIAALLPPDRLTVPEAVGRQVRRNAEAQAALASEFGLPASAEVAGRAGSRAANAAALASRWRKEGRVLAVQMDDVARFPGFQFDDAGRPYPVVAEVLTTFGHRLTAWETALWFTADNDWLGGLRPADALASDPGQVVEAARRLAAEIDE